MIPSLLHSYMTDRLIQIGKEINETCPHWLNKEILNSIKHRNKDKQEELIEAYINQCHEPYLRYLPHTKECFVFCNTCDQTLGRGCERAFPKIAEAFLKEHEKGLN